MACDSLSMDAVDASYGYMCGAGQSLFEKHAACFARVENQKEYISCKTAATEAIGEAQRTKVRFLSFLENGSSEWIHRGVPVRDVQSHGRISALFSSDHFKQVWH